MTDQLQFTAPKRELVQALTYAAAGLSRRPVVPVLAGMRLEVSAGKVTFAGFDYDMTAQASVPASATVPGIALPRGRELLQAVKSMPGKPATPVTVTASEHGLTITASGVTATVELLDMTDYPQLPAMPETAGVVDAAGFLAAVKRVMPAAGTDDTLPVLMTVHLDFAPEALRMVTTDRYRLATDVQAWTAGNPMEQRKANIPARELATFAAKAARDGKISIHLGEPFGQESERDPYGGNRYGVKYGAHAGFSDGERSMIVRTVDADFVQWESLVTQDSAASAMVEAPQLSAALKRAAGQRDSCNSPVFLQFTPDNVTVTAKRDGQVTYSETLPCAIEISGAGMTADGWTVAYNPQYLFDMVSGVDGLAVLSWNTPDKPLKVTPADDSARYLALVMPIRTAG
jgi:DNA polymerase III subunit beta